jgi:hypothetical protein
MGIRSPWKFNASKASKPGVSSDKELRPTETARRSLVAQKQNDPERGDSMAKRKQLLT